MSKRFGRNQRRNAREQIARLEQAIGSLHFMLSDHLRDSNNARKAHQSHRSMLRHDVCMQCGCMVGSPLSLEPCKRMSAPLVVLTTQRDLLLEALESCIGLLRGISDVQNEYIDETVDEFLKGEIEGLIARVKGGVN